MQESLRLILDIQELDIKMIRLMRLKQQRTKELDQIESLKKELNEQLESKQTEIQEINTNVTSLEKKVSTLNEKIKSLEYDAIIIALIDEDNSNQTLSKLIKYGVDKNKIFSSSHFFLIFIQSSFDSS